MSHNSLISPAQAYILQKNLLVKESKRLHDMCNIVDSPIELSISQWAQWFSVAMSFKPDLIIELGRAAGNSTCLFTEAANLLDECKVISLCLSTTWDKITKPKLEKILPTNWFDPLDVRFGNILTEDPKALIGDSKRVLVCWDAHGFDIAEYVLSQLLPAIWPNQHLVVMHDLADVRYSSPDASYGESGVWRTGMITGKETPSVLYLGNIVSQVAQSLSAFDFTNRNGVTMYSADHSLHTELSETQKLELSENLGDMFDLHAHWWYWSLNELPTNRTVHFPKAPKYDQSDDAEIMGQLIPTSENIGRLQKRILEMEASPFWKLRSLFRGPRKN